MKITIYTITDCQFSKAEKEYLKSHNLPFEEKNLEQNKEWLTEMLAVSNNFAGTPVTKIEKDDGQIVVLKGFTEKELAEALGFTTQPINQQPINQQTPPSSPPQPPTPEPTQPPAPPQASGPVSGSVSPTPTQPSTASQSSTEPPPSSPQTQANDPLSSILNDLQAKSAQPDSNQPPPPSIPDFPVKS